MQRYVIEYGPSDKAIYNLIVTAETEADALALFAERLPGETLIGIKPAGGVVVEEAPAEEPAEEEPKAEKPAKPKAK